MLARYAAKPLRPPGNGRQDVGLPVDVAAQRRSEADQDDEGVNSDSKEAVKLLNDLAAHGGDLGPIHRL